MATKIGVRVFWSFIFYLVFKMLHGIGSCLGFDGDVFIAITILLSYLMILAIWIIADKIRKGEYR